MIAKALPATTTNGLAAPPHSHDFMQVVMPARGILEMDVDGRGGREFMKPGHCIECRPKRLPSVSTASTMWPNGPIENFGRNTLPPAASTRAPSTAQSSHSK
mgnify:CR=1 FL=1